MENVTLVKHPVTLVPRHAQLLRKQGTKGKDDQEEMPGALNEE